MRILQVAPIRETIPPPAYGGTEAVVSLLSEALVERGHDVVLRASGDSATSAELRSAFPHSLRNAEDVETDTAYEWVHAASAISDASGFDLIHNHAGETVMALAELTDVPMLTTMHNAIRPDTRIVWDRYSGYYNTISHSQWQSLLTPDRPQHAGTVYNGIDVASYAYREQKDDYLLSLNRIHPEKGTHLAIEVARRTGRRLIIAGKWDPIDGDYYEDAVRPHVDGDQVIFVGEATQHQKRGLYARAACVLMPICWEEPFGLVTVEAMACGTPVIAFGRGAVPELVVDGETGFIVNDVDGMSRRIGDLHSIQPARCRKHVEDNFDTHVMVNGYLRLYQSLVAARDGHFPDRSQAAPAFYLRGSEASHVSETVEVSK